MNIVEKACKIVLSWYTLLKYKIKYRKRFSCSLSDMISPSVKIRLSSGGRLILGKRVGIRDKVILNSTGGIITIGDQVFINDFTCINSRDEVTIGNNSIIGQGVKIYDHDHDYQNNLQKDFICSPVVIDHDVWLGSDAIILRGSYIGEHSIVGAATLLKGDVEPYHIVVNERTSKLITLEKINST